MSVWQWDGSMSDISARVRSCGGGGRLHTVILEPQWWHSHAQVSNRPLVCQSLSHIVVDFLLLEVRQAGLFVDAIVDARQKWSVFPLFFVFVVRGLWAVLLLVCVGGWVAGWVCVFMYLCMLVFEHVFVNVCLSVCVRGFMCPVYVLGCVICVHVHTCFCACAAASKASHAASVC